MVVCCEIGTYGCEEYAFTCSCCGHSVFVDECLVEEVRKLHEKGISTIGCCCGHGDPDLEYIQVHPNCVKTMLSLGYAQLPEDANGNGKWCFKPKTQCPKEGDEL